jgi:hypothetical protein
MSSLHVSLIVFLIIFAGAIFGILLRRVLPREHFKPETEAVIKLVTGFVVTMTGIILGMLVSSSKASYDAQKLLVSQISSEVILLDRAMAEYGPETNDIRIQLRETTIAAINRVWPASGTTPAALLPEDGMDKLEDRMKDLTPRNSSQSYAREHSIAILTNLRQSSWILFMQADTNKLSMPLLVILVSWIVAIFISFGLYAPPNPTVIVTILIGALAVSAAILIIMEMYSPFSGIMRISSEPVSEAISRLKH